MKKTLGWKVALILAIIVGCGAMLYPPGKRISLGLDLKGGMHLKLQVMTDEALRIQTDQSVLQIKNYFKDASVKYESVSRIGIDRIEIKGTARADETKIHNHLEDNFRDWNLSFGSVIGITLKPNAAQNMREMAVDQAVETIRNRVDEFGVAEPVIQKEGISGDMILVQLPGVSDTERVKELIRSTAMLEFKEVVAGPFPSEAAALQSQGGKLADDMQLLKTSPRTPEVGYYVLKSASIVPGKNLKSARRAQDENGMPAVGFSFNAEGSAIFETYTSQNIGKQLAIVLDNRVESAPRINSTISGDGIIEGGRFTQQEVDDLILVLRSGALPAPMEFKEQRIIGPSLGADSIRKGLAASLAGLFLVVVFMLVYYKAAGINSVLALVLNMFILMALMASFRATLTLPGIAGIILSIGMAVDANVLIFERIREELRAGKSPKASIDAGFKKAFWTIFDSNLTTVVSAVFLFQFGTGPVKGFAVTLIIGIAASMFTAIWVSRVIFEISYGSKKKLAKISI